jgi:hypothetical protein
MFVVDNSNNFDLASNLTIGGDIGTLTVNKLSGDMCSYIALRIATTTIHEIRSKLLWYRILISSATSNMVPLCIPAEDHKHIKIRQIYILCFGNMLYYSRLVTSHILMFCEFCVNQNIRRRSMFICTIISHKMVTLQYSL